MTFFLDTNVWIDALKGRRPGIAQRLRSLSPALVKVPAIVAAELLLGARKSNRSTVAREAVSKLLLPFEVVAFDARAAEIHAAVRFDLERRGESVGPNDLVIAATVLASEGTLVTANLREFRRIRGLHVEDWSKE